MDTLYTAYGLSVRSDIVLPGAAIAPPGAAPDLDIAYGDPRPWAETAALGPYRARDADLFEFVMPGVARYTVEDRRRVIITPQDDADEDAIAEMLVATTLPCLLWARGEIVLHASAAARPGRGSGFLWMGPSGAGKSTRLDRAVRRGARAIADDSVRLRVRDGTVLASGLPGGFFLRSQSTGDARVLRTVPGPQQLTEYPIGSGVVLDPGCGRARSLTKVETMAALLRHRHRPRILKLLGTEAGLIATLGLIAKQIRITAAPFERRDAVKYRVENS